MGEELCLDRRKRLLLEALLRSELYLSSGKLAEIAGIAPRTVRNELKLIGEELLKVGARLESLPGRGYRLSSEFSENIAELLDKQESKPVTPDERSFFIINLLFDSDLDYAELQSILNISESTLDRDLERCSVWLRRYELAITRRKDMLSLGGSDSSFTFARIAYYLELSEIRNSLPTDLLKKEFRSYDQIRKKLDHFLTENSYSSGDDEYLCLLIYLLLKPEVSILYAAESLGLPFTPDSSFVHHSNIVHNSIINMIGSFGFDEPDDALINGICSISYSAPYKSLLTIRNELKLQQIEKDYPEAVGFALYLNRVIKDDLGYDLQESQLAKIGLCYAAFMERGLKQSRKRAALVCGLDDGTTQLLSAKLSRIFSGLEICGVFHEHELGKAEQHNPDFLITTSNIKSAIDSVRINQLLNDDDFDRIISILRRNSSGKTVFERLCKKEYFHTDLDLGSPDEVIHFLCTQAPGGNLTDLEKAVIERERIGSTFAANLTAMPHAVFSGEGQSFISIAILSKPVRWGTENVQLVLLLNLSENIDMASLFEHIYSVISDRKLVKEIIAKREFKLLFKSEESINA